MLSEVRAAAHNTWTTALQVSKMGCESAGAYSVSMGRQRQLHFAVAVLPVQLTPLPPLLGSRARRLLQRAACSSPRALLKGPMLTQLLSE